MKDMSVFYFGEKDLYDKDINMEMDIFFGRVDDSVTWHFDDD
jgi:hypothetical protein